MYYYCSWYDYDWTVWHNQKRRKALLTKTRRDDWNNKVKLPKRVATRKGCWL